MITEFFNFGNNLSNSFAISCKKKTIFDASLINFSGNFSFS